MKKIILILWCFGVSLGVLFAQVDQDNNADARAARAEAESAYTEAEAESAYAEAEAEAARAEAEAAKAAAQSALADAEAAKAARAEAEAALAEAEAAKAAVQSALTEAASAAPALPGDTALTSVMQYLPPVHFGVYAKAIWAPLIYRADGDGQSAGKPPAYSDEPGFGVGAGPGWDDTLGAALGLDVWGSNKDDNIGFDLRLNVRAGDGDVYTRDNTAYLWVKPMGEFLKMQMGMYRWDELRGKVGGIGEVVGGYGGDEDSIFQRLESDTFGALFIITPPSFVPDTLKGFMLFGSFGVSGKISIGSYYTFAANAEKLLEYVFTTPHAGIAYRHGSFGLARLQFIGGTYKWGEGSDWYYEASMGNTSANSNIGKIYYPRHSKESARLEAAVNITRIPNLNLDLGFGLPLPIKVVKNDSDNVMLVGPKFQDLGYRMEGGIYAENLTRYEGDVWQPPMRFAMGADYRLPDLNLAFRLRTKIEFGERVWFVNGSDDFRGGLDFEAGLDISYTFPKIGTVSLDLALRANQNDAYNGGLHLSNRPEENNAAIDYLNHNGVVDLGLGAFFTRRFGSAGYLKTGFAATLPMGGDRYDWSPARQPSQYSGDEVKDREAYKKGNFIITIPIIVELKLY
jgi:hypothetical protein